MPTRTPEMATRTRDRRGAPERRSVRLDHLDDDRLALAVARHGAPAFELLYERLAPRVYGFCCSMLRDPGEAEDVLQETMTRAYHALSRPREEMQVKAWLFAIARNACIDRVRQREPQMVVDGPVEELLDQVPSAQTSLEDRERLRVLIADLGSLSEAQRTALALREMSGLAHEEIATSLDTTPARVKSLISEARRGLAERAVGREMPCEELRRTVTEGGGRALRGKAVRSHMEGCAACGAFVEDTRQSRSLGLLMPALPATQSKSILAGVLGGGAGMSGSGIGGLLSALGAKQLLALLAVAAIGGGVVATGAPGSLFGDGSGEDPAAAGGAAGDGTSAGDGAAADPRRAGREASEQAGAERGSEGTQDGSGTERAASTAPGTAGGGATAGDGPSRLLDRTGTLGGGLLEPLGGEPSVPGLGDLRGTLETDVEGPTGLTAPTAPDLPAAPDASLPTGLDHGASGLTEATDPVQQVGRSAPEPDAPSVLP